MWRETLASEIKKEMDVQNIIGTAEENSRKAGETAAPRVKSISGHSDEEHTKNL